MLPRARTIRNARNGNNAANVLLQLTWTQVLYSKKRIKRGGSCFNQTMDSSYGKNKGTNARNVDSQVPTFPAAQPGGQDRLHLVMFKSAKSGDVDLRRIRIEREGMYNIQ